MSLGSADVLFIGYSNPVVAWYRTGMPSFYLGCDWISMRGDDFPDVTTFTSLKRNPERSDVAVLEEDYKIVVLQQPRGVGWMRLIRRLRERGVKVLYEIDDYIHGVGRLKDHAGAKIYTRKFVEAHEICMRLCDGIICSTPWLAAKYKKFNPRTFVCKNGIESGRYGKLSLPQRETTVIGWAGGVGHQSAFKAWLPAIEQVMDENPLTRFVSIGEPFAALLGKRFGERRLTIPQTSIENFPAALCNIDVAIAPAGLSSFYRGKSDLRWLEVGALGIPLVADPRVYPEIEDRVTGFYASTPEDAYKGISLFVEDRAARAYVGLKAQEYIAAHRSIEQAITQWEQVFVEVVS